MARSIAAALAFLLAIPFPAFCAGVEAPKADIPSLNVGLPAVSAHPVVDILNQLQAQGVSLPETAVTPEDAAALTRAAQALPQGSPVRQNLLTLAKVASGGNGSGAPAVVDLGALMRAFDNASAKKESSGFLSSVLGLSWLSGRKGDAARRAYPEPGNPEAHAVALSKLRWVPAAENLPASTRQIPAAPRKIIGQDGALTSIYWGLKMPGDNHNLYVSGPDGSGRETSLLGIAEKLAAQMPTPDDRVAVTNVADRSQPLILTVPAGQGPKVEAALEKFVATYQGVLPKVLNSGEVLETRRKISEQVDAAVEQAQAQFDADVAQIRLPGGKFGLAFETEKSEGSTAYYVGLTYAKDGKFEPVTKDQTQQLVASGAITQAELDKARKDASAAGKKVADQFQQIKSQEAELRAKAEEALATINLKAAASVATQLRMGLLAAVSKNRHDTPAHKAYEQRAAERLAAFEAESAKPTLGQYGFVFSTDGKRIGVQLARVVDGQVVPMEQEELEAKLASGELTQEQIKAGYAPLISKYKAVLKQNDEDHRSVHAADAPVTEDEKRAVAWADSIAQHAASHYALFLPRESDGSLASAVKPNPEDLYLASVLATNEPGKGAPVVFDRHPSLEATFGSSEERGRTVITDKGPLKLSSPSGPELKGGTFLEANGGIWIAYAADVLKAPGVFQALMQAVRDGQVEIVEGGLRSVMAMSGDRHPVSSKVKVVLIGSPNIRMLLAQHDEDFARSFQATAEFASRLPISEETISGYLQFLRNVIDQSGGELLEMSREAISAVLQYSARILRSNEHLSARFGQLKALLEQASFWAREAGRSEVRPEDINKALVVRSQSPALFQGQYQQGFFKGVEIVETQGAKVGQLNGLAVVGGSFGAPMRVTIVASAHEGGFQAIFNDNEAGWTGEYFKKSAADVEGFLENVFGQDEPLNVKLSIAFEQTTGLDGDSATSTMMYGSLSRLSGVPIKQTFAVTGSADQFGNVQAIGGINEKIEGFFDLCRHRGLTGDQGIVMPISNVGDLMLRPDIVEAVRQGQFHIYAVSNVKQGIEILTGVSFEEIVTKAKKNLARMNAGQ